MIRDLLFIAAVVGVVFVVGAAFAVGCNLAWWAVDRAKARRCSSREEGPRRDGEQPA